MAISSPLTLKKISKNEKLKTINIKVRKACVGGVLLQLTSIKFDNDRVAVYKRLSDSRIALLFSRYPSVFMIIIRSFTL
jgi:hypothetical protein